MRRFRVNVCSGSIVIASCRAPLVAQASRIEQQCGGPQLQPGLRTDCYRTIGRSLTAFELTPEFAEQRCSGCQKKLGCAM